MSTTPREEAATAYLRVKAEHSKTIEQARWDVAHRTLAPYAIALVAIDEAMREALSNDR